jgi:23S rRNA pseudouridine2605 synthase
VLVLGVLKNNLASMPEIRLQKILNQAGVASRRRAEELILSGKVRVNGNVAKLGDKADPEVDKITVGRHPIEKPSNEKLIYLALNKPKGYMSSKHDPQGRPTIFKLLPPELRTKVWNVGRLDYQTEGLLLMTNDGELTQKLAHPSFEHEKEYEVVLNQSPTKEQLKDLRGGVKIATGITRPANIKATAGTTLYMIIHEGKKRQIRRMLEAVDLKVKNLKRIRMGKLKLPNIPVGTYKEIKKEDII